MGIGQITVFHSTLEEVMHVQKRLFPSRQLPWLQVALSEEFFRVNGTSVEGIVRLLLVVVCCYVELGREGKKSAYRSAKRKREGE